MDGRKERRKEGRKGGRKAGLVDEWMVCYLHVCTESLIELTILDPK